MKSQTLTKLKVADEVWIATALLHREHPAAPDFSIDEIVDRARREGLPRAASSWGLRSRRLALRSQSRTEPGPLLYACRNLGGPPTPLSQRRCLSSGPRRLKNQSGPEGYALWICRSPGLVPRLEHRSVPATY